MKFKGLKPGDKVFVVHQTPRRHSGPPKRGYVEVHRVGRKYATWLWGSLECPFRLEDGCSHHGEDSNARANGYGFNAYHSEQEWKEEKHARAEHARLQGRLFGAGRYRLVELGPEAVQAIHTILDQEGCA